MWGEVVLAAIGTAAVADAVDASDYDYYQIEYCGDGDDVIDVCAVAVAAAVGAAGERDVVERVAVVDVGLFAAVWIVIGVVDVKWAVAAFVRLYDGFPFETIACDCCLPDC